MKKIKHTKNELKRQKEELKRFLRYLPTLLLKKRQLQTEIAKLLHALEELETEIAREREAVYEWAGVFSEGIEVADIVSVDRVEVLEGNIAGIDIPIFEKVVFTEREYDLMRTPLWVDYGAAAVKRVAAMNARYKVLLKQLAIIKEELRITTQRVSLFEKIKIPEARENIRRIRIFLGDMQTAAVVTGKIAKKKIEKKAEARLIL
jgi:V/A-type H+-transporting ATPase subunit D